MNPFLIPVGEAIARLVQVYESADTIVSGDHRTTVNELTDQLPALRPDTLSAAMSALLWLGPIEGSKILTEEDKGAMLVGLVSMFSDKPVAMARWYSYSLPIRPDSIIVPIDMEYLKGQLVVNGICKGDRLTIVDDTLSTGGTAISLIQAARMAGAKVVGMRVVNEKLGFGGRERLLKEGINVKSAIGIRINSNGKISVDEVMQMPRIKV